ncbi:DUF5701 family protein [Humibacillus xanthopallidus]|uniref:Uncharacterized protein n=1 Tax=Humibacillus xanthopallidus TaxID=412689 RepID=A0A543I2Q8_9MICO|nr:DUF5701 family protein [Humibacillus xanthopallidus]TQM64847.1 hypothetical protein FBY41_1228 [Humibacillus xanthopallidus]
MSHVATVTALPPLSAQADRLVELGVHDLAGMPAAAVRSLARSAPSSDGLLVLAEPTVAPSALAPLLRLGDRGGFVVEDMTDVDAFAPIDRVGLPSGPGYVVTGIERGDEMSNWTPDEALQRITEAGRTPLTLAEGIHWALQVPGVLERNLCFMTIGSRRRRPDGRLDARTPALWISNGTGRDGRERRGAPKVGWCWARNRHTWLGFASAADRLAI